MNKEIILSNAILLLGVFSCLFSSLWGISYNVDSIYDEGFLFFSQQSALKGHIVGISQGTNIIAAILGERVCSSILNLRIAAMVMKISCAVLFMLITSSLFGKGWKHNVGYGIMCMLMLTPHMSDLVLCSNGLAQLFFCLALALGYRVLVADSVYNVLWCLILGICLVLGVFSILPGAILLAVCLFVLLLLKYWGEWKKVGVYVLFSLVGCAIGILLMHLFVNDIRDVFSAMQQTAINVTTLDRGYDPLSFLSKFLLFLRDWSLCCVLVCGVMFLADKIKSVGFGFFANIFVIGILLVYMFYQKKPMVTFPMLMSSMWIALLYNKQFNEKVSFINILNFDNLLTSFLILSPVILSIGTNTYLGGKMSFFMLPWVLLIYRLGWKAQFVPMRLEVCIVMCILLILPSCQFIKQISDNSNKVEQGPLKGMHLTESQAIHFSECEKIVKEYNFQPMKSVIYSTQLGMMTICYLDGVNCANYFQPMDFVAHAQGDKLPCPDFLFLCEYDIQVSGEQLRNIGWGWPEDFDVFEVGTPESIKTSYPTERMLYCRKSLKTNE